MPFIGVALGPAERLDEALGPVQARVQARHVPGAPPEAGHPRAPAGLMLRAAWFLLRAWVARRHRPSPFRAADGAWISAPHVLDAAERARLASAPIDDA